METNVRYTVAGCFVLVMIGLIAMTVIWLTSGMSNDKFNYYIVYMKESVSGLNKEGRVEFNGVEVGTVDQMILNKNNPQLVTLVLKIKDTTPITYGTKAKLGVRALSGTTFILLEDKGNNKRPLMANKGEPYPVIETEPSILVRLDSIMNEMSTSFHQMSSSLQSLLSKDNIQLIKRVLQKLGG
jgi:phospholipid/cholesterol/gamma-HCH transport system substrate-binding protein